MHHGDYTSVSYTQYPQNPNPIPNSTPNLLDHHPPPPPQPSYASAPPFTAGGAFTPNSDYSSYPSSYAAYPQHSDPVPTSPAPNFQSYNPPAPPLQQPQSSTPFPRFEAHGAYQPPTQPQSFYPPFDQPPSYAPSSNHSPTPNSSYSSIYPSQYNQSSSEHENPYDNRMKFDQSRGYLDETAGRYGSYGSGRGDLGQDYYGKRPERDYGSEGYGDGVYAYQGSKVEPYGARGTAPKSSTWSGFDDFGRPIGYSSEKDRSSSLSTKTVRAVPKAEAQQDVKNGVQKFRVKLLAESGGQSTQDVLCQVHFFTITCISVFSNCTFALQLFLPSL